MKMKYIVTVLIIAMVSILLTACGGGGGGTSATPAGYSVGGTINGVWSSGSVLLQNNGKDDLTITSHGTFTFSTSLSDSSAYSITVKTPPTGQNCTVNNGAGTVSGADISNVSVVCFMSSENLAAMMGNSMAELTGAVDATPTSGVNGGVSYTITPLGYSFCVPSDPFASPAEFPANGYTVFGCINNVSATISITPTQATLRLTMPVFGLVNVDWNYMGFSDSFRGYAGISSAQVDIVATIADAGNGVMQVVSVDSVTLTYAPGSLTVDTDESTGLINSFISIVESMMVAQVKPAVEDLIKQQVESMIPMLPLFLPD